MLICPTNAGVILGVDLLTRSLVWAHAYQVQEERPRSEPQVRFPRGIIPNEFGSQALPQSTWGAAAPIVHRGHVIFTAPDAKGLHVLHLRDGSLVWRRDRQTAQQAGDLYLAGVDDDRVIVVGQKSVRALSLSNRGEVVWETNPAGPPGGRGVRSAGEFSLPLRAPDARDRSGGEIWTLNARTGEVRSRMRARPEALGNLIFVGGDLVTQGVTRLAVFPQLASKEREIAERLEANPTDPLGLAQSGELKLHRGDVAGAVADLRAALAGTWTDAAEKRRARDRLFDALCDLTDRRFAEQEQGLAELYELAEIPAPAEETGEARKRRLEEQTDRQVRVLRLVARGRETQSRFADALRVYLDFEAPSATLVQSPEEPAVQIAPAIWVQGRIRDLFERATPAQRAEMERVVADQWEEVRSQADGARLQRFADNYGPLLPEGRAALLLLADRLVAEQKFPEARLKLLLVLHLTQEVPPDGPDAVLAAQALDALGRLNLKQGLLEDAAFYFKQLATRFPKVKVRDGRTGEELYLDLATDKRFLPYLSRDAIPRRGLLAQPYTEITRLPQSPMSGPSVPSRYWATYASEPTPLFQRLRIGIDPALRQCRLVDVNSEADRGGFTLESFPTGFYPQTSGEPQRPLIAAHPLGQIVVLSWVNYLYAFDVVQGKLLWKHDLFGPGESPGSDRLVNLVLGPNGRFMLLHASRNIQEPVGALGVVTPRHIVITSRGGLVVLDP
ncbi:MAG TPA: PQQ-binding-like beta-propeller repeat protein, partial [Gemmatales bacterium]|nr:PQQ-binding-like beta-propeller repeat protein [Gemmatales bacterium]